MTDVFDPGYAERLDAVAPDEGLRGREFVHRTARAAGVGLGLAATLGPDRLVAAAAAQEGRAARRTGRDIPIDTFVVVMMENRSFDHFLGWMPNADGRQAGLTYLDGAGIPHATYSLPPDFQGCGHPVPGQVWPQARVQFNGGAVDGFLQPGSGNDTYAIGYYEERNMPFLAAMTRAGTTCDRYFASLLAATNPNRSYAHAATSYGDKFLVVNLPGDPPPQFRTAPGFAFSTAIEGRLRRSGLEGRTFYAKAGKVVHTRFGRESILRMVEDRYRLKPLTVRDAKANSIAAAFDFTRPPRTEPPHLPTPPSIISEPCPEPSTE